MNVWRSGIWSRTLPTRSHRIDQIDHLESERAIHLGRDLRIQKHMVIRLLERRNRVRLHAPLVERDEVLGRVGRSFGGGLLPIVFNHDRGWLSLILPLYVRILL